MDDDEQVTLLDAVDGLTKPVTRVHWLSEHDHEWEKVMEGGRWIGKGADRHLDGAEWTGQWICSWHAEPLITTEPTHGAAPAGVDRHDDAPLLEQLRDAVGSSMESGGQGGAARERVPIDVSALTLYEKIDGFVRAWMLELGARPGKDVTPAQILRSWYVLWNAGRHAEADDARYARIISGWASQIRDKLEPPTRIEITAPCPNCGAEYVNVGSKLPGTDDDDPDDVEMARALTAVERDSIEDSYAICAGCKTVWLGAFRMRQLRIQIDDAAKVRVAS